MLKSLCYRCSTCNIYAVCSVDTYMGIIYVTETSVVCFLIGIRKI